MVATRLNAQDAAFVYGEDSRIPLHLGCLALLDAAPLRSESGALDLPRIRDSIDERLHRVPLFRRRLVEVPFSAGRPVWVDDPEFRIERHVHLEVLPRPAGRRELLELMGRVQGERLDRRRPLWDVVFVDGLGDAKQVGLIVRVHHSIADGTSGVAIAKLIFDLVPGAVVEAPPWSPEAGPGSTRLWIDAWKEQARDLVANTRAFGAALVDPKRPAAGARKVARALGTLLSDFDQLPFNARVGRRRAVETLSLPLDDLLTARRVLDVKLNDVVLAAVAGALRRYLGDQGIDPDEATRVKTLCPVDNRDAGDHRLGSNVTAMFVDLPVDEPDAVLRVERVAERSRSLKALEVAEGANVWSRATSLLPPPVLRATSWFQFRGLMSNANLMVSNVRGPGQPFYCLGARVRAFYPYFGVQDGLGLNVVLFSYDGSLFAGLAADPDLVPNLGGFAEALRKALGELARVV